MDKEKFLKDCEQLCFDCGGEFPKESMTKISDGVCLCQTCFDIAEGDYPEGGDKIAES